MYFRVVDYKTGKKSFDYCDVFNGVGLHARAIVIIIFAAASSFVNVVRVRTAAVIIFIAITFIFIFDKIFLHVFLV